MLCAASAQAQIPWPNAEHYGRFVWGKQSLKNAWTQELIDGVEHHVAADTLHRFGFDLQSALTHGPWQWGLEAGLHAGYDSRRDYVLILDGQESRLDIDSPLWFGEFSMGGFASARPLPFLRFYAGAGPSFYWGQMRRLEARTQGSTAEADSRVRLTIDTRENHYDMGVALYGHVGGEVRFTNGISLGLGARRLQATLDFGQRGRIPLDTTVVLFHLGFTQRD